MHTTKLKLPFSLVSLKKEFVRTVASAAAIKSDRNLKPWKEIPGPSSLPIIGQLHHFMPGGDLYNLEGAERNTKLYKMYGPIVRFERFLGKVPTIILYDPESCAKVLLGENPLPVRPGFESLVYYRKYYKKNKVNNTGLITEHGDLWKDFRSIVNSVMLKPKTIKLYTRVLDEVARDMIARLKVKRDEKNMIRNDLYHEINLWALESNGIVGLGCRLNCFDPNLPGNSPEWQLIQCIDKGLTMINKLDFEPHFVSYFAKPYFWKAMKVIDNVENLAKYFIEKGKEQLQNKTYTEKGVLEKLLEIDENVAHVMATDMIFAGLETVSTLAITTLYHLAVNPEKQDKLREEIMLKSEQKSYLKACIKESLRVMPATPGTLRLATKEYNLLGYKIPKNVNIIFAHQDMSLLEENFPRPQEYIPERWLVHKDDPLYYGNAHPFTYAPFGFGVRSCIGRRFAQLEVEILVARMIENFKLEWVGPPPKTTLLLVNYINPPYNFIFNDIGH